MNDRLQFKVYIILQKQRVIQVAHHVSLMFFRQLHLHYDITTLCPIKISRAVMTSEKQLSVVDSVHQYLVVVAMRRGGQWVRRFRERSTSGNIVPVYVHRFHVRADMKCE